MIAAEKLKTNIPTGNLVYQPLTPARRTITQEESFEIIVQEVMRRIRLQEQRKEEIKWLAEHQEYTW